MNPQAEVWHKMNTKREVKVLEVIRCTQTHPIPCFESKWQIKFRNYAGEAWKNGGIFVNQDNAIETAERIFAEVEK